MTTVAEQTAQKACRSTSPDGKACTKPRGHKKRHAAPTAQDEWTEGVNNRGFWHQVDDGHMSEGEYQAYGRFGY